ncbi:MAG: hypothetical protein BGN95_15665 [Sphingomonas sp. 66-10]|uniref:aspartyl protease family protein n=1 Tax=Sphingomonas sp. 66-10 TaxID=1895848 RepID=UPI00092C6DEA|nr:aspartyl protease family protein [Sphingomonas sp. 66-10]OJU17745.1 MAG: hypothetical protein BGN95_15665 [Sphingomonas sp. 66-10]
MKAALFAALGLMLGAAAPAAADAPAIEPTFWLPDAGSGWINFDPGDGGQVVIPVVVNGQPARALVDTGFDQLVLSKAFADAHHLALTPLNKPIGFGGASQTYATPGISLDIGAMRTTRPGALVVTDFDNVRNAGLNFDAVIGLALLARLEWQLDEDHHRFRFLPSHAEPIVGGTPVRLGPRGSRLVTTIGVNGAPLASAMIDLGSDDEVSVPPAVMQQAKVHVDTDLMAAGAGGAVVEPVGRLGSLTIGGLQVEGAHATSDAGWFPGDDIKALIGMGILQRYDLTVDVPAGMMKLTARTTPAIPRPKSTSGVQGAYADGRLLIAHVMKNSPAEAAGLKAGDAICALDDKPMSQQLVDQHWGRAAPGTRYAVRLCDGTARQLVLRDFY